MTEKTIKGKKAPGLEKAYDFDGPTASIMLKPYEGTFATAGEVRNVKTVYFNGKGYLMAIGVPLIVERAMADTLETNGELVSPPVYLD